MQSVFLVGFMAAGKTTIGPLVANRLGLPFVDLDHEIQTTAGMSIPAVFRDRGETHFRELERDRLRAVIKGPPAVVATGGGTPASFDNLLEMRQAGFVVALHASLDTLLSRAGDPASRPLLLKSPEDIAARYHERQPIYRQAHAVVDVEQPVEQAARAVADLAARFAAVPADSRPLTQWVGLGSRSYPIVAEEGVFDRTREWLGALPQSSRVAIITDANVGPLYADRLQKALSGFDTSVHLIPAGETSKSLDSFGRLADEMVSQGLDRRSVILACGGGVVGDLAGLVAATLYRGISYLQIPTTLLAMVDSAIGGKTGINLQSGKNLVGAFWQPQAVLADPMVLATLPPRERRAAFAEILKYALLDSQALFDDCARVAPAFADDSLPWRQPPGLSALISRCAAYKAWVVSIDETERSGLRALLNLGHTIGHAIEAEAGYGRLLHGEAIALGLVAACRLSHLLGLAPATLEQQVSGVLAAAKIDFQVESWLRSEVLSRVHVDKKRTGAEVGFICLGGIGWPQIRPIPVKEVQQLLRRT